VKNHPPPAIPCELCSQPINLISDLSADENGKAVHAKCYAERLASTQSNSPATAGTD
jgi:hypothetical protein